jgi:PAS domain S-box-containing protein
MSRWQRFWHTIAARWGSGPEREEAHGPDDAPKERHDTAQNAELQASDIARVNQALKAEIARRQRAEESLRESEVRYRLLLEHAPAGLYELDLTNAKFTAVNDVLCEYTGYTCEEFLSLSPLDLLTEESQERYLQRQARILAGEEVSGTVEYTIRGKDREFRVNLHTRYSFREGEPVKAAVVVHDITERARAEQLLRAINHAALAMEMALNQDEMFAAIGEEFKKLGFTYLVLPTNEDQTRLYTRYLSLDSSLVATAQKLLGTYQEGFSFPVDDVDAYRQVIYDRETVFVEDTEAVIRQVLPQSAKRLAGLFVKLADYTRAIVAPLVVEDDVIGLLSVQSGDLTRADMPAITAFAHQLAAAWRRTRLMQDLEKSLEELKQTQSQLLKAQRMEAVGRLAGGVAHDFNNLLTIVQVNAQLLKQQLHRVDPLWECAEQILEASERAASLTRQLLRFSSSEVVVPVSSDLGSLVTDLGPTLQRIIGEENELVTTIADDLWTVRADPTQTEQVLVNLALNARDAMPLGGRFSIEVANLILDDTSAGHDIAAVPGEYVLLKVSDTGTGMTDEVREHLFEPFFTTKEQGRGTGLGLSTVYGIVKQSGGDIWVDTQVGQGTTFNIYLPRFGEAVTRPAVQVVDLPPQVARGSETILLVEDEAIIRELTVQILEADGYQVLEAMDGKEALCVAGEHGAPIHLLLTDVLMPGVNGQELADKLRLHHPDMHVLFMSGYDERQTDSEEAEGGDTGFLPKPFSTEVLRRKVRRVLDRAR